MHTVGLPASLSILALLLFPVGCAAKSVNIIPIRPDGTVISDAQVRVDGQPVGQGATRVELEGDVMHVEIYAGTGWEHEAFMLTERSPDTMRVGIRVDQLYRQTTADTNQVVNRWITMDVGEANAASWWPVIIGAISGQDFAMEMMDRQSGFVRTAWRRTQAGDQTARRRFMANLLSQDPIRLRIRYEVEVLREGTSDRWDAYDRGFGDDLEAIDEIRGRLH